MPDDVEAALKKLSPKFEKQINEQFSTKETGYQSEIEQFKDVFKHESNIEFKSHAKELSLIKQDSSLASKREVWHKNLKKDILQI